MPRSLFTYVIAIFFIYGCNSGSSGGKKTLKEAVSGKIEIAKGWARPGLKGNSSAVYLTIVNDTGSPDTLIGVFTEVAEVAEIHNSYENDDGIMSMKPAKQQIIKAGKVVNFEPGGLHIMLMELKRNLTNGDSLRISLEFARTGIEKATIPVKIQ